MASFYTEPRSTTIQAFENIDQVFITSLFSTNSWLLHLIAHIEHLDFGFFLADSNGYQLVYVNQFVVKSLGYERSEILRKNFNFFTLSSQDNIDFTSSSMNEMLPCDTEKIVYRKDGKAFKIHMTTKSISDAKSGSCVCSLSFFINDSIVDDSFRLTRKQRKLRTLQSLIPDVMDWIDDKSMSYV
jgi:PAS domain S-box-containing protein